MESLSFWPSAINAVASLMASQMQSAHSATQSSQLTLCISEQYYGASHPKCFSQMAELNASSMVCNRHFGRGGTIRHSHPVLSTCSSRFIYTCAEKLFKRLPQRSGRHASPPTHTLHLFSVSGRWLNYQTGWNGFGSAELLAAAEWRCPSLFLHKGHGHKGLP